MKHTLFFSLYLVAALAIFSGCSSHQAPKLVILVSSAAPAALATEKIAIGSPADASEDPSTTNIDSLIENADSACANYDYALAQTLLQKALRALKNNEENGDDDESGEYYKKIAAFYMESMPPAYEDSIPDEISLLTFNKKLGNSIDTLTISSSDSIMLQKTVNREKTAFDIPITWNDRIYKALCFLNRGGKGPLDKWISQSLYYMPTIKKMFIDSGMPADLSYLPLIESGFNPLAYSPKHAAGMWQFIPSTGKRYGLQKDCWIDERRDFMKSTRAAISYFKKLYKQFNDWHIAIGSYNCGENAMSNALNRASAKDFWSLKLPRETMHYVPKFLAALVGAKNQSYGNFSNGSMDTFNLDTVTVNECVSLYAIADTLHIASEALRKMNPHILHWCTHPHDPITLYLPAGTKKKFLATYDRSPFDFIVSWYVYKVKSGENVQSISRRFKVSMEALLSLNFRSSSQRLSIGQALLIPISTNQNASRVTAIRTKQYRTGSSFKTVVINGAKVIKYRVRPGDCLWGLSQLFHVSKNDLCGWNNISDGKSIRAGMVLTIYKTPKMRKVSAKSGFSAKPVALAAGNDAKRVTSLNDAQKQISVIADVYSKRITYYRVRKGDTLRDIAQSFKIAIRHLTSINDIAPDAALLPGKVIKVPLLEEL